MLNLVTLTRNTRGKGSRPVEFSGVLVEVQSRDDKGQLLFTEERKVKKTGEIVPSEPIMVPVNPSTLPEVPESIAKIVELEPDGNKLKFIFAKCLNAVAFAIEVEKTATVVASILDPLFAEFGITDADKISTLKRAITSMANQRNKDPLLVGRALLSLE